MHQYADKGDFTYKRAIESITIVTLDNLARSYTRGAGCAVRRECRHSWSADLVVVGCL